MSTVIVLEFALDPIVAACEKTKRERPWADHVHFDGSWCPKCMPPKYYVLPRNEAGTPILPADDAPPGTVYV